MRPWSAHASRLHAPLAAMVIALSGPAPAEAQPAPEDEPASAETTPPTVGGDDPGPAEEPEASPREVPRRRVAVLILATGGVDPLIADDLSELLIGALAARGGLTLVGKEEFQAQLGQGDDGTLECISSLACLGRVGVQLDVVEVVAGTLAHRDERWVFNLNRTDLRDGQIVGRVFREVEGDLGAVADALNAAIPELYAPAEPAAPAPPPAPSPGNLIVRTEVEGADVSVDGALVGHTRDGALRHELPAGPVRIRVTAPGYYAWERSVRVIAAEDVDIEVALREALEETIHPWVWVGAGAAGAMFALAATLGALSQGELEFTEAQRMTGDVLRAELVAFYDARQREAIAANVLFALAGAAASSSVVMLFFPERHRAAGVVLAPTPHGLDLRGTF